MSLIMYVREQPAHSKKDVNILDVHHVYLHLFDPEEGGNT